MRKTTSAAVHMRRWPWHLLVLAGLAAAFAACASGDRSLDAVDPQAVTADPTYEQVFAIVHNKCASCHNGSGEGENESFLLTAVAAEDVPGLDDCASIVALREDILARVEDNTMPPGALPRLTSEEKLIVRRWVANGAPAPCN